MCSHDLGEDWRVQMLFLRSYTIDYLSAGGRGK